MNTSLNINRQIIINEIFDQYPYLSKLLIDKNSIKCFHVSLNPLVFNTFSLIEFGTLIYNKFKLSLVIDCNGSSNFVEGHRNFPYMKEVVDDKKILLDFLNSKEQSYFNCAFDSIYRRAKRFKELDQVQFIQIK